MEIKSILVPTDFSRPANNALDEGIKLAYKYNADLVVLHARVMYEDDPASLTAKMEVLKEEERKVEENLLKRLRDTTQKHRQVNIRHEIIRGYSSPSAILSYLNNNDFDLVIIGTHGRTGLGHFLIGSVTEKVVRYAPSPVMTVSPESRLTDEFHHIIVPFDYSDHAQMALKKALHLVESDQSEVTMLYVFDREVHPALAAWGVRSAFDAIPDIEQKAKKQMDKILADIPNPKKARIKKVVMEGAPHKGIKAFVDENDADLLVIATHGRVGLDRFLLGSTTERVIRSIPIPVLTLKQQHLL